MGFAVFLAMLVTAIPSRCLARRENFGALMLGIEAVSRYVDCDGGRVRADPAKGAHLDWTQLRFGRERRRAYALVGDGDFQLRAD